METSATTMPRLREHVAEEVRALLGRRRTTGAKLAVAIGRSEMYVSRRLRGETAFDTDDLEGIARFLGVDAADLLPPRGEGRLTGSNPALGGTHRPVNAGSPRATETTRPPGRTNHHGPHDATRRPARTSHAHTH